MLPAFVAIDFETADDERDSACAIGLVRVEAHRLVARRKVLIRPPRQAFKFTEIHGLTWADVEGAHRFGVVWRELSALLEGASFLAAHGAGFDRSVLESCCRGERLRPPRLPWVCTLNLSRQLWGSPAGLAAVCERLEIPLRHHDPLSDAEACAMVLLEVERRSPEIVSSERVERGKRRRRR